MTNLHQDMIVCETFSSLDGPEWGVSRLTDGKMDQGGWRSKAFAGHGDHRLYPEYVTLDLGTNRRVSRVVLHPAEGGKGFPEAFTIQVCREGEPWRTLLAREHHAVPESVPSFDLTGAEGRFVKVEATRLRRAEDGAFRFQLAGIEVWGESVTAAALEGSGSEEHDKELKPTRLRCENRDNPVGMDEAQPRFSWRMQSPRRAESQTSYRILVASTREKLTSGEGDLWDSGRVESDQTVAVRYAGAPLESGRCCFWKVKLRDKAGNQSSWSDPAWFVTGKFTASDWQGMWIGANVCRATCSPPPGKAGHERKHGRGALYFRGRIPLDKPVTRATVFFCGLGWSELAVDGRLVDDTLMAPGFTTYDKRTQYLVRDVTEFLSEGSHVLDVTLLDGWYALERDPWVHDFHANPYVDQPKLLLELHVEHPDGTSTVVMSDESWRWSEGPITRSWVCEADVDRRIEIGAEGWKPAVVVEGPAGRLVAQKEPPTRVREIIRPIGLEKIGDSWAYTFDREFTGFVRFRARGPRGTTIRISTRGVRADCRHAPARNFDFVLKGEGVEEFSPRWTYTSIASVCVCGTAQPPRLEDLEGCRVSGAGPVSGGFRCSSDLVNWLHGSARRTQANYVTYLPNDPSREYKAWTQDIMNMFRSAVYLFDSQTMYERWQWDMLDVQASDGNLPDVAPGPLYDSFNSPWWGGCAVWLPWHWYLYYGDASLLKASYPAMKRYVDFLTTQSPGGIQDWGLSDWLSIKDPGRPIVNTPAAVFFARVVSHTATMLGQDDEANHYARIAEDIRGAFNAGFLDPERGVYGKPKKEDDPPCMPGSRCRASKPGAEVPLTPIGVRPCTQGGQVLPLMLDVVPLELRNKAEAALLGQIRADNGRLTTGFVGTPHLLEWLGDHAPRTGWAMTTAQSPPSWYSMTVGSDSDQMMETWNGGNVCMPSLGGHIGGWNVETLAGIRPDHSGPGFRRIIIKPNVVGNLHWAEGWYDSVRGRIESKWRKRGAQLMLEVTIPANTTATVYVPARTAEKVCESGRPAETAEGVRFLRREEDAAVFEVGSGAYRFEARPLDSREG